MACRVQRNPVNNKIEKVIAENGKESILFKTILGKIKDSEEALTHYAYTFTPTFKTQFKENKSVDKNGEFDPSPRDLDAITSVSKPNLPSNQVNYSLQSVDVLTSEKAVAMFAKGKKNGWDLNKILTEIQVPKAQKQIILDRFPKKRILTKKGMNPWDDNANYEEDYNREEIITSLLAENSFVVEVNHC
jgi:hypothetical protein